MASGASELRQKLDGALGSRVEDRVATAHVGLDGMIHPGAIAERDAMLLAGTTAGLVVAALGEE